MWIMSTKDLKFKFNDLVIITSGFYEWVKWRLVDYDQIESVENCNWDSYEKMKQALDGVKFLNRYEVRIRTMESTRNNWWTKHVRILEKDLMIKS